MNLKLPNAFEKAVKLLYYHNYFSNDLAYRLAELDYREKEIKEAIQKCKEEKYLNDENFGKDFIEMAQKEKNWGYNKIYSKMYEKHVPVELIKQYLSAYYSKELETESKEKLKKEKEKKLPAEMDLEKKKGILQRFLYSKGF